MDSQPTICVLLLVFLSFAHGEYADVSLVDVYYIRTPQQKRTMNNGELDDALRFRLRHKGASIALNLKRNLRINENAPVFTLRSLDDGKVGMEKTDIPDLVERQYQDRSNGGYFAVRCVKRSIGCHPSLSGSFYLDNNQYILHPLVSSRNVKRRLGGSEKYVLRKRVFRKRHYGNDLRRVKKQHTKQDELENDLELLLRLLKRSKRSPKKEYAVEMSFFIDNTVYEKYRERATGSTDAEKRKNALYNVRRHYALVANAMDARYDSIVDPDMTIYLRLKHYIISESRDKSVWRNGQEPKDSNGAAVRGQIKMDVLDSFTDAIRNTEFAGKIGDHAMLFVKDNLVEKMENGEYEVAAIGVSTLCNVCTESKTSIVHAEEITTTIDTAAHELGHNLGADHDGTEGDAKSCDPEKANIMTPSVVELDYKRRKNAFTFSSCSVKSFKGCFKTLDEDGNNCLLNKAEFANKEEWEKHVKNLPGQVYSANAQCKQDKGENGMVCKDEINEKEFCFRLPCKDGEDGACDRFVAARGTSCGDGKWCIESDCVADSKAPSFKNIDDRLAGIPLKSGASTTKPGTTTSTTTTSTTTTQPTTTTVETTTPEYYDYETTTPDYYYYDDGYY